MLHSLALCVCVSVCLCLCICLLSVSFSHLRVHLLRLAVTRARAHTHTFAAEQVRDLKVPVADSVRLVRALPADDSGFDGLIVMGAPFSVRTVPSDVGAACGPGNFIESCEHLIHCFHKAAKPVLGICLGAQLIARAFGGSVLKMKDDMTSLPDGLRPTPGSLSAHALPSGLEYGFISQDWNSSAAEADRIVGAALRASRTATYFQSWHEDTFALPPGAVVLSSRENCHAQAFRLPGVREECGSDSVVWGFQYHSASARCNAS